MEGKIDRDILSAIKKDVVMGIAENKATLYRCIEFFNKCTLEWVDTFYSKDLVWNELPTPTSPRGRSGGFNEFRNSADQLLRLLPDRKLSVKKCVAEDDNVVFEQELKGTVAVATGNLKVGDKIFLKIVTFFKLKNGLIVEHTDYSKVIT